MPQPTETPEPTKLFPVRLTKNYRPAGDYEVVGYHRPQKTQKDSTGRVIIVQEAAFIDGEIAPPPFPGVGFQTKVWADTVLRLPMDEAKRLVGRNLAVRADALPG
jgi:hypothetical protein